MYLCMYVYLWFVCQMCTQQPSVQRVAVVKETVLIEVVTASLATQDQRVLTVSIINSLMSIHSGVAL